ncbi:protein of unknown function DUF302 [Thioalkalivibrio sp. K90mix]|uniref:DUF302 domain-containing protein n=1 Tax=Thioalkalivibrio sp. (strain K90mix) TaxID=396595 RepID=UPI000195A8BB|nr:DUF302 domain-containing protein [Thioalkalivibrio sp. K90mix]ADC71486.1 protein of unknown function DUF302 [Thioalkalivibrio sp. K90mix]
MLETTTRLDPETAVERLKQAIEAQGLKLVSHINGQANAAKIGVEVPTDQILEVFHPSYAVRVWQACKHAGIDIPLRIHVSGEGGVLCIRTRSAREVFKPWASPELDAIGAELDPKLQAILDTLEAA